MNKTLFYVNSPCAEGMFSVCGKCAEESENTRTYCVTGGIGFSGIFIKEVAQRVEREGLVTERFLNFYGGEGLDGVCFPEIDVYIFDGNISFFSMPLTDCRSYIINLGATGDKKQLYFSQALIKEMKNEEEKYFEKAGRFIATAQSVRRDIVNLTGNAVNAEKIERFVSRFIKKELGTYSSVCGREYFRMLTAVTPDGIAFPTETIGIMCPKLYCIDDKTGAVSSVILSLIRENALICGFDVINLLSPFGDGKSPEHIIIPEAGLGIITSDENHRYSGDTFRRVSAQRFFDSEKMKKHRGRIKFNLGAEKELLNQAFYLLGEGRKCRDKYYEIYSRFYDREKIKTLAEETTREIMSFISCT